MSLVMEANGTLIRRKRAELGHGLNRFAALIGLSGAALSRIENGQRNPRPETLKKITDALGCQIKDVLARNGSGNDLVAAAKSDDATGYQPAAPVEQPISTSTAK